MNWISVTDSVPETRRRVLAWGESWVCGIHRGAHFLGSTQYNPRRGGNIFDVEIVGRFDFCHCSVTHWAEIVGPEPAPASSHVPPRPFPSRAGAPVEP